MSSIKWQPFCRVEELNRIIILPLLIDSIERSVLSICDDSWVSCLFIFAPLSLFHHSPKPFGRPSASLDFGHSLTLSHYHYFISSWLCPRHNSRRRSLSMLVPRKEWTVLQLKRVYGMMRVPRNLDCTLIHLRSLLQRSINVLTQKLKPCRWEENHSEMTVNHELEIQKEKSWWLKDTVRVPVNVS